MRESAIAGCLAQAAIDAINEAAQCEVERLGLLDISKVGRLDLQRIEQRGRIVSEQGYRVGAGRGAGAPVTTRVVAQHAVAVGQRGQGPVPHVVVRHQAVAQHHHMALCRTVKTVGDLDTINIDMGRHKLIHSLIDREIKGLGNAVLEGSPFRSPIPLARVLRPL